MKTNERLLITFLALCTFFLTDCAQSQQTNPCLTAGQTCYFGVEINNILCGYSVENYCEGTLDGKNVIFESSDVTLKMTLLGAGIDIGIKSLYWIDPSTAKALKIDLTYNTGKSVVRSQTVIRGDTAFYNSLSSGTSRSVALEDDVILYSPSKYPHLINDFNSPTGYPVKHKVYEPMKGEVIEKSYVKVKEEDIVLGDSLFHALVLEETDVPSGVKTLLWLNREDGYNVNALIAGRRIFFADQSVIGKIQIANMNDVMFARVNMVIQGFQNMEYLKVKARINTYGEQVSEESLNNSWQKFTGTVNGSLIDGIFETKPVKYDGMNAPSFPPDFSSEADLKKYIIPELMIESDDPLIKSEAEKITAGSADSWVAAVRLSKWVSENIRGALPGGGSAINTLKMREAECGGHSRLLVAFCRAVGIPARLSTGCMYVPYYNGSFGQHAWTEVYMGEAGWIPVDATIHEINYINASHIRLGEKATFQPEAMEIIDYSIKQ